MKKALAVLVALGLLGFGAMAFAHGGGDGPGYGSGGYGKGGHSCGGPGQGIDPEKSEAFFKETYELRKTLHGKMFELKEAYFSGDEEKAV